MGQVSEDENNCSDRITSLREGGMLAHPTEPIILRGGLKGGGRAPSLLCLSSEKDIIYIGIE